MRKEGNFIPATMARAIGTGVFFRPMRSWHSGTYAGERLYKMPESNDRSGCLFEEKAHDFDICSPPLTVTHRNYWHERDAGKTLSAFLSYPGGMGADQEYFWEVYWRQRELDIERFYWPEAEAEMEVKIRKFLMENADAKVK